MGNTCYNARQPFETHTQLLPDQRPPDDPLNTPSGDEPAGEDLPTSVAENNEGSDEPMQRFTQAIQWPRRLAQAHAAHPPPVPLGATLEPCPWLNATEKGSFLPHFLWDVSKRKTVDVSLMNVASEYSTVSHTWGRWMKEATPNSPLRLPVDNFPWPVPRYPLFDVQDLPNILGRVPGGCPYVWLDLICIPQVPEEDTDCEYAKLKRQEIARQASIFSRAKHSVVWFSNVDSFQALQFAVYWMALYLVEHPQHNSLDIDAAFAPVNDNCPTPPATRHFSYRNI